MSHYPALELLIAGERLSCEVRETIDVLDPATGEVFAALPKATPADLDAALEATARGFTAWRATSADQREAILRKGAALIRERAQDIGAAITREQGKPVKDAVGETLYCAMLLEFYAGERKRNYGRRTEEHTSELQSRMSIS